MAIIRGGNEAMFSIRVEGLPDDELRVLRLRGEEGISQLFRFDVELVSENANVDFKGVVGKAAALGIAGTEEDRWVNGVVSRFEQGSIGKKFAKYFVQVVPRFWRLLLREDSRVFQDLSAPDIVKKVFEGAGIPAKAHRASLKATYPSRGYCVQYQESDWAFVSRLLEEEGIFYFFEHTDGDHVLVLGDDPSAHGDVGGEPEIPFHDPKGFLPEAEYVGTFRYTESVRTGAVSMRDYNPAKPNTNLEAKDAGDVDGELEAFEFPGRYTAAEEGKRLARIRLGEQTAMRKVGVGHSVCRRLIPGYKFSLSEHRREDFNRSWLVTDLVHEGYEPQALEHEAPANETETEYTNEFRVIPADVTYRPLRTTPRPTVQGPQSALVVGPKGEEIYTDEYGRVKVQFFWDRRGKQDEKSSCWVRVAQPPLGGSMVLPRIGWEVLVEFIGGDIDQPVVIGRLWNANHMPPYTLPDQKNMTSLKSSTTPGGGGFNEIRLDDSKGKEQIFLNAQKQLDARVGEDSYELVGKDAHLIVKENQVMRVEGESHLKVDGDDVTELGKDLHLKVKGKEAVEIGGSHSFTVKGDVIEVFKANHSEQTTQNYYLKAMGVVIEAMSGITIKCGPTSYIVIDPSGVTLKGMSLALDGVSVRIASGPGSPAKPGQAGSAVAPIAPKEAFEADEADPHKVEEAKAQQIAEKKGKYGTLRMTPFKRQEAAAGSGAGAGAGEETQKSFIEIELVDDAGNPVPGEPYEITLPDGKRVATGTLDHKGFARVDGIDPGTCKIGFPRLDKDAWKPAG